MDNDSRHSDSGKQCGTGVYFTPSLNIALSYAGSILLGGINYRLVIIVRDNPS